MDKAAERMTDDVRIRLEKEPGTNTFRQEIEASSPAALIYGLARLIVECAKMMGIPADRVFAVLATVLFGE